MKLVYIKEILHSSKKNEDFYVLRLALQDENGVIIAKSKPVIWLTREQFDKYNV